MTKLVQQQTVSSKHAAAGRLVLLMGPATYRAGAFMDAAKRLGLEVIPGVDIPEPLHDYWDVTLPLDFNNPEEAAARIVDFLKDSDGGVVVSVDDGATALAARAAAQLGLAHNDPDAALAAKDKLLMRQRFAAASVPVPWFKAYSLNSDPDAVAAEAPFPCVIKPTRLSGSRGVIRANDPAELVSAFSRTREMLLGDGVDPDLAQLLVESFIPGFEVALEGLLTDGKLTVLALFDKPDPLDGPFFEETIYVTPSRLDPAMQNVIASATEDAAAAIGLRHGPVHAELRINDDGVWPIELAGRSIGGLCSTILEFGAGLSLEDVILRHAVGLPIESLDRGAGSVGVMMIPIPKAGLLRCVDGIDEAKSVAGVTGIEISARLNYPITPLPEGSAYLGFIFAKAPSPEQVEESLRRAHDRLQIRIDRYIPIQREP